MVALKDPILLVGLPGIGNIGNLVVEHLKNELKAKKFATLHSAHFPFQVIMINNGQFRLVNNRFYYFKNAKGKRDILLLLGDAQSVSSEGQYEVNEKIIEFFMSLGGKEVYTIGGYSAENKYVKEPRVFGVATDKVTWGKIKALGVSPITVTGTPIFGSAGMIIAFAKKHGLKAACLMGETGLLEVDANSSKAVLLVLNKLLGLNVNLGNMDKLKDETERMLKELEDASKTMANPDRHREDLGYIR